jgi:hypothetical protein
MPQQRELSKQKETAEGRSTQKSTDRRAFALDVLRNNQPQEPQASSSRGDKRTREERSPTDTAPSSPVEAPPRKKMTREEVSSAGGIASRDQKKGVHGMSNEKRQEATSAGGRAAGNLAFEQKKGIYGMSAEELRESKSSGGNSTFAQKKGIYGMSAEELRESRRAGREAKHALEPRTVNDHATRETGRKKKDWES